MTEQGAILRSRGEGAYELGEGASRFAGWFGSVPLSPRSRLVGSYMTGFSSVDNSEGLFRDFGGMRSDAFSVGLFATNVAASNDRIGFIVSQPLRVASGAARLAVPVGRPMDGTIIYTDARIDLAPRGRELDFEVAYKLWLNGAADLSTSTLLQLEPGHVRDADPAVFNGIRVRVKL